MAILKEVKPAANHICETPKDPEKKYGAGTVFACDVCGKQAILTHDQRDGWVWMWLSPGNYVKKK